VLPFTVSQFDWDEGNSDKNQIRHGVSDAECEQVFFNRPLVSGKDEKHSRYEARFYVLGQTDTGRKLFIVFTVRGDRLRVITARDMSRRETGIYEHADSEVEGDPQV